MRENPQPPKSPYREAIIAISISFSRLFILFAFLYYAILNKSRHSPPSDMYILLVSYSCITSLYLYFLTGAKIYSTRSKASYRSSMRFFAI